MSKTVNSIVRELTVPSLDEKIRDKQQVLLKTYVGTNIDSNYVYVLSGQRSKLLQKTKAIPHYINTPISVAEGSN